MNFLIQNRNAMGTPNLPWSGGDTVKIKQAIFFSNLCYRWNTVNLNTVYPTTLSVTHIIREAKRKCSSIFPVIFSHWSFWKKSWIIMIHLQKFVQKNYFHIKSNKFPYLCPGMDDIHLCRFVRTQRTKQIDYRNSCFRILVWDSDRSLNAHVQMSSVQ